MLMQVCHPKLLDWTSEQTTGFGKKAFVGKHRLHELQLFSDEAIAQVLDSHPRDRFQAFTMGNDASKIHEWRPIDVSGLSGKDIISAIARGRFWFHLFRMQDVNPQYKELLEQLFSEVC